MFNGEIAPTRNYAKHANAKIGKITGKALSICSSPYAVIDIDINHSFSDNRKQEVRDYFESIINDYNIKAVKTLSGGLHLYSNWDSSFKPDKDSYVGIYDYSEDDEKIFSVDLFVPFENSNKKGRWIMLPNSEAKNKEGVIGKYELIKDCNDSDLISFSELKQALYEEVGIEFTIESKKMIEENIDEILNDHSLDDLIDDLLDVNDKNNMTKALFDTIVKGFDKNITIHNDCGSSLNNEVSILPIITALNACVNDEITQSDVNEALQYIHDNCTLTANAQNKWYEQIVRNANMKANHYGGLFTILKKWNAEYYDDKVKPLIVGSLKKTNPDDFLNERYTISDYKREKSTFTTYEDYVYNLVKCLAFIDNGKFIIKEKDNNKIKYSVIDSTKLNEILNFEGQYKKTYIVTQDDVDKARKNHRKIPTLGEKIEVPVKIKMMKLLRSNDVQSYFKRFEKTELIGDDKEIFGLYRPPNPNDYYSEIKDDQELVQKFIRLINDQLFDDEAKCSFNHFLNTHAYLLQYRKKSNVFFIKYSTTGNSGKNYIDNAFSKLYDGFSLNGVTEQQLTEKHNGGMINKLYRAYDEFDNSNYQNKSINNIVKRLTNNKMAARAMCTDTKEEEDFAIDVLNTNDPGVYGMLKGGTALLSRLCIIRLKERDIKKSEFANDMNVIDDENFGYSLYNYLMNIDLTDFVKERKFNRYPLERTNTIAKQLLDLKITVLDEFLDSIYDSFEQKKYKGETVDVIPAKQLQQEYDYFMRNKKYRLTTSFESELEAKGLHKINSMRFHGDVMQVYYRTHIERKITEYEVFDDESDEECPIKEAI